MLLLNTALSLVLFILLPNHCCQCIFLGYMYSSLRAAYLVTFVLPLFYWFLTCLQHWSQWTFNTSCRFSLVQFCYVPGRSSYVALRFSRLFLAVISILALQFFVSYIAEFCFRTMWCEHLFLLVYALMQGNRKRGLLSFVPFFLNLPMTERGACSQSLCLTIHSPLPPFNYYSAALFFAHALFLCFSVVHLFASSLCFWHRRHRARKKPTETFAFFLSTCSTPASLVMAGSPLFLSLSFSIFA